MADSLEALISWFPNVVVGTVTAPASVEHHESTIGGLTTNSPVSIFPVSVERVVYSPNATFPKAVTFAQSGVPGQTDLPEMGKTYIFFLED